MAMLADVDKETSTGRPAPSDWPAPGPIDLQAHDLPHTSSTLEWWYVNCHLTTEDRRQFSLFAAFFRTAVDQDTATKDYVYAHALNWALIDLQGGRYIAESLVDKEAPAIARRRLERDKNPKDALGYRALRELVDRGQVPQPDMLLNAPATVNRERLALVYDGRRFEKLDDDTYRLTLSHDAESTGCELTFTLQTPPIRHGTDGEIQGPFSESMFYYFVPRCLVQGTIMVQGQTCTVTKGSGWYDHEFGLDDSNLPDAALSSDESAVLRRRSWHWISIQLDNLCELTVYCLFDDAGGDLSDGRYAVLIDAEGHPHFFSDFSFRGLNTWTSSRTFTRYPTKWVLEIPEAHVVLTAEAVFAHQEFVTIIAKPSFWEGRVHATGVMDGLAVQGLGFVERTGLDSPDTLQSFFAAVGQATRESIQAILPLELDERSAAPIVASETRVEYLQGVDLQQLSRTLIAPVRSVVDRGGKVWRSYALLACCDVVGGNSQPLIKWLALPELMHVGSLIVDDVEDKSTTRRGGAAAHHVYGEALAINAGCSCYFLPQPIMHTLNLPDAAKLRIYDLYFIAMRAAHSGQALDIAGFGHNMPLIVETGDGAWAQRHVQAVHRLKSAVPVSSLGQVGAILGGGSEEQIRAVGKFLEHLGIAFQIVDDVLNLTGFENDLKGRGEDITQGKVTMPVAKAMSLLDREARHRLWSIVSSKPEQPARILEAITIIEQCGALAACRADAERLVEEGWMQVDPLLPNSQVKLKLRAFGWYVLERHY